MKTLLFILIFISLFLMTFFIVLGIVKTLKGLESKKFLIIGMCIGIIPLVLATILLFMKFKGL